jgi:Uri superfamily endonuclease
MLLSGGTRAGSGASGQLRRARPGAQTSVANTGNPVHEISLTSIPKEPGTYILLLEARSSRRIPVGVLGMLDLRPGFYVYVGSALGPGGLRGRLARHSRRSLSPHWHVDYIRRHAAVREIWFSVGRSRREHLWAAVLARSAGAAIPLAGFGASDCSCLAHLFRFSQRPCLANFRRRLEASAPQPATASRAEITCWIST